MRQLLKPLFDSYIKDHARNSSEKTIRYHTQSFISLAGFMANQLDTPDLTVQQLTADMIRSWITDQRSLATAHLDNDPVKLLKIK